LEICHGRAAILDVLLRYLWNTTKNCLSPQAQKEFPQLVENYRQRYASSAFLPAEYGKRIRRLLTELRKKHGMMAEPDPDSRFGAKLAGQMQDSLF